MERETVATEAAPPAATWNGILSWGGILAGFVVGAVCFMILFVLGLCLWIAAMGGGGTSLFGPLAVWGGIWIFVSLAIAAYLAGRTTGGAAGLITPLQGRLNALVTGMLLLLVLTYSIFSFTYGTVSRVAGLAGSVAGTVGSAAVSAGGGLAQADWGNFLQRLGLGNDYHALVSGLNQHELTQLLAQQMPNLNQKEVAATVATVRGAITTAAHRVGRNLSNLSDLGQVTSQEANWVQEQLSGPVFISHLESHGLTPAHARQVESVLDQRIHQLRQQAQQTTASIEQGLENAGGTAASVAGRLAGIWLLVAAILLGFAMLGGANEGWAPALRFRVPAAVPSSRAPTPGV